VLAVGDRHTEEAHELVAVVGQVVEISRRPVERGGLELRVSVVRRNEAPLTDGVSRDCSIV
jgi:hypothetical protein